MVDDTRCLHLPGHILGLLQGIVRGGVVVAASTMRVANDAHASNFPKAHGESKF